MIRDTLNRIRKIIDFQIDDDTFDKLDDSTLLSIMKAQIITSDKRTMPMFTENDRLMFVIEFEKLCDLYNNNCDTTRICELIEETLQRGVDKNGS